jgi:hypothetical protein
VAASLYFNNFGASNEQQLIEDLVVESVRVYGNDVHYIPYQAGNFDDVYGEDPTPTYGPAFFVEAYIKSIDGFEGDGLFLSKFGLEIRDQITLSIAKRTFNKEVGIYTNHSLPLEGDVIYFTLNPERAQLYVIKYVSDRSIFFQLGGLQVYDLVCELYEYSGERFRTGIPEIDAIEGQFTTNMAAFSILTQDNFSITDQDGFPIVQGSYDLDEQSYDFNSDNEEIDEEADNILDWTEIDPFSEGYV